MKQAGEKQGLKIPDDIALVGFSESRSALLVEPQLTTICQPFRLIG
ncbi:MAG: substrate-binding domain-containing protein, partial [Prevotella sp.]|nr:substrate-binding domain-containing protein [Prevotella sp.]